MATEETAELEFVPMIPIVKKVNNLATACSDWVATEKIHGSNFQFFTKDGQNVYLASRRTLLDKKGSFLRCNMPEFHRRHLPFITHLFRAVETGDRWQQYRTNADMAYDDDDEETEEDSAVECQAQLENGGESGEVDANDGSKEEANISEGLEKILQENKTKQGIDLRIYGELYGGGGITKDIKFAVQKEIIYADDFRFYVFGININRKWTTVAEMNNLCEQAGFPYYAVPVCPSKATIEELTKWLTTSGFMKTRSKFTDKTDDSRVTIEGVVMTPLKRSDFRLHAVKLLASAFNDVRNVGKGQHIKVNYCTKARYNSVLSKLDLHEREDTLMVTDLFIADITREGGEEEATDSKRKEWTNCVRAWLRTDGYLNEGKQLSPNSRKGNNERKQRAVSEATNGGTKGQSVEGIVEGDEGFGGLFD